MVQMAHLAALALVKPADPTWATAGAGTNAPANSLRSFRSSGVRTGALRARADDPRARKEVSLPKLILGSEGVRVILFGFLILPGITV
jgi:hypothetical protein